MFSLAQEMAKDSCGEYSGDAEGDSPEKTARG